MHVVIIDYGSGNLRSVTNALQHVAKNDVVEVSADPKALEKATHILLPGVGAFGDCVAGLSAVKGMLETLAEQVMVKKKPFLGICVGMQMLFEEGLEHGNHEGLKWLKGRVVPLAPQDKTLKIPHMGWNELRLDKPDHPLFKGIEPNAHAYFVHSFHADCSNREDRIAHVDYGGEVTAAVARDNITGVQFHPEKSQQTGLTLLRNFMTHL